MRLSCLPVSFFPEIIAEKISVVEWARMGKSLGLDGVDLSILFVPDRSLPKLAGLRRQVEDEGIRIAMVTTYPDFTHPDPAQRKKEVALESEAIAAAAELGAEMVRVTAGQAYPGVSIAHGTAWAVEGLHALSAAVAPTGVKLVYENHAKPMVWEFTDFSQPPEIFQEIVRATADIGLHVNFDTGNAAAFAADPVQLLQSVIDRVYSIHASDTACHGALEHVLLGTGVTPYPALFSSLQAAGWDGWICMEEASRQGLAGVAAAARFIRETWLNAAASAATAS
jgi:sugar phosphate isomerase/epimerase